MIYLGEYFFNVASIAHSALSASTNRAVGIFAGMPFLSAGASAMPMILGFLTDQVCTPKFQLYFINIP